ncbi:MAG TPA: EF-P lysine aminoacylase EpmA [Steroidobacteraceae bacterium]|jgi:lysyl-tRNA synthetase class 2|nr:EF-P lysine aminoacylase EpmA [Steroidobacteraceae bacterium]
MTQENWRPGADRAMLEQRAALFARVRAFFAARGVLEVDTPCVVNHAASDVHIQSARVDFADAAVRFLHTSPEYAMKRLLAAGSGDIFQICHVVRTCERSRLHNSEFTLLEWYRTGFSLRDLMAEVEALLRDVAAGVAAGITEQVSYAEAFRRELALDPFAASTAELAQAAQRLGFVAGTAAASRDDLLDFLMALRIGPGLGRRGLAFIHSYPASQAALARRDPQDARAAERFELYREGVELANGYHELASTEEQRERFIEDNRQRQRRGLPALAIDEHLLAALAAGLPDCAGVALGMDRLLMLSTGAARIDDVIAFATEWA